MSSFARGVLRGATGGLGNLATALAQGDATQRMAADREGMLQSRLAAQLTQQQRDLAAADFDTARAENERLKADFAANRPALQEEQAALMSGVDLPLVRAIRESIRTGKAPQMEMAGPTEDGAPLMGDLQVDPKQRSAVAQALSRTLPLVSGAGEVKVDDWAKALGAFADQDLQGQAVRGELPQDQQDRALAVLKASPLFKVPEGYLGNQFSGAVDVSNPVNAAQRSYVTEKAGAQKANAVQSLASANSSNASAAKTRADMAEGTNGRGGKAPTGYRWGADGQTLEFIPGGPADPNTKGAKLAKPPTEGQAKALMFGTRMAVADEIISGLGGKYSPAAIAAAKGADGIPIIGGVAGRAATAMLGAESQQALQAQRDFINAVLRRESGAVISDSEFANAALQYFPQPEDRPEVLRQKAANRKTAIAGLKAEFGEAMTPEFDKIVNQARTARQAPSANTGSTTGSWDDWKIERVQ